MKRKSKPTPIKIAPKLVALASAEPVMVTDFQEATASYRRNAAATIERSDKFLNIQNGISPFTGYGRTSDGGSISVSDAVDLCQKAYYNFSVFRNVIDLMTEFSVSEIYFKDGTAKSREFFTAYCKKINLWDLQDRFFREYYRGGNVFIYKYLARFTPEDISKITQVFGGQTISAGSKVMIPTKYVILNPSDIRLEGAVNFGMPNYFKILNNYELQRLRHPLTDEDKEVLQSLPLDAQKMIKEGHSPEVLLPLLPENTVAVFYKKQDYEPFAVPMGYPVLEDINFKYEMKKIDMAVARTMQQAVLLITAGNEPDKHGINPNNLTALQKLFENQSVGRVLVADYTTKAEFIIPQIADLLDPQKYEVIDRDINVGLNNIFAGGEKFANQTAKMEVFIARLKQGRQAFINNFFYPEIKKISKDLGFKSYPTPVFEEIDLKDDGVYAKIYSHLAEIGVLTPEETIKAIETNSLPDADSSIESQKAFKANKDAGLYQPLVGAAKPGEDGAGRPVGTPAPKTSTKVGPIGGASASYSCKSLRQNVLKAQEIEAKITSLYKKQSKVKVLSASDSFIIDQILKTIVANEEPAKWEESVPHYLMTPEDRNKERIDKIHGIAATHDVDFYMASLLLASEYKG